MASNKEFGYDEARFETAVNRNFYCLICFNVLRRPVMCRKNQHYFCFDCITQHLQKNSSTCPTCADELTLETLTEVPRIVRDYLDELNIHCDYYDRGCRQLVQLQSLNGHVAECGFAPVACKNQGCCETVCKRDRTYHENELCEFRKLGCHDCAEIRIMTAGMFTMTADMNTEVDKMHTKVNKMDTDVTKMDTTITNMNAKVAALGTKLGNLNSKVANADQKIANMNTKVGSLSTKTTNVETKIENLNTKMAKVDTNTTNLHTKVADLNTKMMNMETKIEKMDTNMVNMEAKFETVSNEVKEIKESLNEVKDGFNFLRAALLEKMEPNEAKRVILNDAFSEVKEGFNSLKEAIFEKIELKEVTSDGAANDGTAATHILVAGGTGSNSVELFNYERRNWSSLKPMIGLVQSHTTSFVHDNYVTIAGGTSPAQQLLSAFHQTRNMFQMRINPTPTASSEWKFCDTNMPDKLYAHDSVLYQDSLFVLGGVFGESGSTSISNSVFEIQLKPPYVATLVARMPQPRIHHKAALFEDSILIFGGRLWRDYKTNFSSVLKYDIKIRRFKEMRSLPYQVSEFAAVKRGENAIILGGVLPNARVLNDAIVYNMKTGQVDRLPPMLYKRRGCMAVAIGNEIVALGGSNQEGKILQSVEAFSFDHNKWQELPAMKEERFMATAVAI